MATRVFSDDEWEALRSFPAIGKDELIQFSPRIRDLDKISLYRMGTKAGYEERFP
ncbi:hypothetical protein I3F58_28420 [Streptomyces sp. MUM 203J]|uniref:transposase n=1 Tax=Streptomyces sp. MUM 203J TaxID=2791990 RepID=UPI001F044CB3|nr:transposase [Streptomyces sp. MUM 203J]MCH0543404.1 hypothetical protein [Streptomyces sp. MUM 203J]